MGLADVFNAVAADALLAGLACHIGAQALDVEDAPPKMVWVPRHFDFDTKRVQGTGPSQQSMGTMSQIVEIHLWAAPASGDVSESGAAAAAEVLFKRVVWAIRNAALGSVRFIGGDWTDDSLEQLGREIVFTVAFDLPIVLPAADEASTLATVVNVNPTTNPATSSMTETIAFPSGDITRTPVL